MIECLLIGIGFLLFMGVGGAVSMWIVERKWPWSRE